MSRWKRYLIKKQQKKKRAKKVARARAAVLELLEKGNLSQAEETARGFLVKYPDDVRAWRLVTGVEAWKGFNDRLKGLSPKKKKGIKERALKILAEESKRRDNLTREGLSETLIALVPPESAEAPEPEDKPKPKTATRKKTASGEPEAPAEKKTRAKSKSAAKKKTGAKKAPAKKSGTAEPEAPAEKKTKAEKKETPEGPGD